MLSRNGGVIMIVNTVDGGGGVTRIWAAGEIDFATVAQLDTAMTSAISAAGAVSVIVDMADVTFCDSAGIAAFERNHFLASQSGVAFRLINVQPIVSRVLEITGMLDTLTRP
ncbi:STAS domain-containing protein [Actinoplanes sp. NPDC051633]|uniref:STAS domain-containing protein n=1 Tax=Actinoplanes sp. NPDC051633 TaxID=3155670 RepID=UPI00343D7BD5